MEQPFILCLFDKPPFSRTLWITLFSLICDIGIYRKWKLLDRNYIWSSFSTVMSMRQTDHNILKDTLQLKISRIWTNIRANSFTKTWEKILKRKSKKVSLESYKLHKNLSLHFEQHCTKTDHISFLSIHFFFSQTNLQSWS